MIWVGLVCGVFAGIGVGVAVSAAYFAKVTAGMLDHSATGHVSIATTTSELMESVVDRGLQTIRDAFWGPPTAQPQPEPREPTAFEMAMAQDARDRGMELSWDGGEEGWMDVTPGTIDAEKL